jgi:hypothetical protein
MFRKDCILMLISFVYTNYSLLGVTKPDLWGECLYPNDALYSLICPYS